ncbi:MAG: hypothetical protein HRT44_05015, partial [Bdellovibrionales bacterium]|nr:hypothetical protein [Bdellovibrionales bacterium]NQZ18602.1 hypothetical protein [Bdellovibrionales bacterium]
MKNTETKDIRMKKAVVVASLSYVVFISVVFAIILFQTINSSETSIAKKIAVWEQEIAQNVFQNQNQDYLEKILNDLKEHYYVDFYSVQHNNTDYLASSEKAPSSCFRPLKTDLSLSGLPLGHVDTCLSKSLIVQASIFSPAFSSLASLGLLVFFMI